MTSRKTYLEITIPAGPSERELLIPPLLEIGCHGFLETESSLISYIDKNELAPGQYGELRNRLDGILTAAGRGTAYAMRELKEENWNLLWEESIQPVEIGTRLVIEPSWKRRTHAEGKIVLEIDPKMSFGTGHHETTRLCLKLLEATVQRGDLVLDVGTGTGILAIAAVKLGARAAVGIDNDEWSIENALENVKSNHVEETVRITRISLEEFRGEPFDCVLANLTLNLITDSLPLLHTLLRDNGVLMLSGFLQSDLPAMRASLALHGFENTVELEENGWSALAARKLSR